MIRTRIVCTIGPAAREPAMLRRLIGTGLDVARLNMSHADHDFHAENIRRIREASAELGRPVAILIDLQGPKLRIGDIGGESIAIAEDERVVLTTAHVAGARSEGGDVAATVPVQYEHLPEDVKPGERILIDDGLLELEVLGVTGPNILCRVITGGVLADNKGVNLPGTTLSIPSFTQKDRDDLMFALSQQVDWVALSFVRSAQDVLQVREIVEAHCDPYCPVLVMAKIEKPQALEHIDAIIEAADGIMVARGDLGIEIPTERVPTAQKKLIQKANAAGKPVITATQMLDSMVRNPRPTRAEASDVANAILDGSDAIMLSAETATGKYPLEAVETMVRIAEEVERAMMAREWNPPPHIEQVACDVTDAVSHATCVTAHALDAAAIITATASGRTARAVARYRPHAPIVATTPHILVQRQLMLTWGVIPLQSSRLARISDVVHESVGLAVRGGHVQEGQRVVVTAGVAATMPGTTNLMTVELAGPGGPAPEPDEAQTEGK